MSGRAARMLAAVAMFFGMLTLPPTAAVASTSAQVSNIIQIASRNPATLSYANGKVTVGDCAGQITTYDSTTVVTPVNLASVPDVDYCTNFANGQAVTDSAGRLYVPAASTLPNNYNSRILAFNQDGSLLWNIDPPSTSIIKLVIGANGNLYGISSSLNGLEQHLFGYSGLSSSAPSILFDKTLVASGERNTVGLAAYGGGLAVQYYSALVEYFNYDGSARGSVSLSNFWNTGEFMVSQSGQVYLPIRSNLQNTCPAQSLPLIDHVTIGSLLGNINSEALPTCTSVSSIKPLPDGGAVMLTESDDGTVKNRRLIAINFDGSQRWMVDAPYTSGGTKYDSPVFSVTASGDIAVAGNYTRSDANYGVMLSLLSGADGQAIVVNDIAPDSSLSVSYRLGGPRGMALADGKVYLAPSNCNYSTNGGKPDCLGRYSSLVILSDSHFKIDSPRGSIMQGGYRKYYALGDSFASGESVEPFEIGTDEVAINDDDIVDTCHRSLFAYAKQLEQNASLKLQVPSSGFVACSGAETENVFKPDDYDMMTLQQKASFAFKTEDPQAVNIQPDADIVTISIGGNDIGFADFVQLCLFGDCSSPGDNRRFFESVDSLGESLRNVYEQVLQIAPNAKVYAVGYPQLLPSSLTCSPADVWMTAFSSSEMQAGRELVVAIDDKIKETVQLVGNERLIYIDPLVGSSPFVGHELCTDDPYFNGVYIAPTGDMNKEFSFHPNQLGVTEGYYRLLSASIAE
ncbi:MAG: GDSL-type esterase/lipase family protein [Candidatus Woesebacteria bacterium]|jgi:hypothetical protein